MRACTYHRLKALTGWIGAILVCFPPTLSAYPIDGYQQTGIRRLACLQQIVDGRRKGGMPPAGALKPTAQITLHLTDTAGAFKDRWPAVDPQLQSRIDALFPNRDESYSLAVVDITPGRPARMAVRQADRAFSPGSVGKLAIAAGIFAELRAMFPEDPDLRRRLLRQRVVTADDWIRIDDHKVPVFDPDSGVYLSRAVREGDRFSLYEWMDHMLSASANSAAAVVWKELLLMRRFGRDYPPSREAEKAFFEKAPKTELRDMAMSTVNDPLRAAGIGPDQWQLGSFFTSTGKRRVPPGGKSYATPLGLMRFLLALESGQVVDAWSSLEIKRLMYMTARRIRYASSPALAGAAVYFKSGSLYRCRPEPGFVCAKYKGNVENVMNSVVIVEQSDGRIYLVSLMSDVLYKNSAVEHQSLGTFIDRALQSSH